MTSDEDDLHTLYSTWQTEPTPENLHRVVKRLEPVTRYALRSYGAADNPLLVNQARLFTADAVKKYNPYAGTKLTSWTAGQLRQLGRAKREQSQAVRVPERAQLDMLHISRAEKEFMDKHNREPDVLELADHAKMPVERIQAVRRSTHPQVSQSALGDLGTGSAPAHLEEAVGYIHGDCDHVDRRILELKTGYGGSDILQPNVIAAKLGLTPSQLSRRSARLALKLHDVTSMLEEVQGG